MEMRPISTSESIHESMENESLGQISKLDLDLDLNHTMYYVKSPAPDSLKRWNKSIQIGKGEANPGEKSKRS
jgi:hypothetical protein